MASTRSVLKLLERTMWDPRPTQTDLGARQLAAALGYPAGWRVVRTLEEHNPAAPAAPATAAASAAAPAGPATAAAPVASEESSQEQQQQQPSHVSNKEEDTKTAAVAPVQQVIVDRIYAGRPSTGCDMWFHHGAAMKAAQTWVAPPEDGDEEQEATAPLSTPFDYGGGHLLPRLPKFDKGDKVQVFYQDEWWDAKILRRKRYPETFRYQVYYSVDKTKQSGVDEEFIRPYEAALTELSKKDAGQVARELGLEGWQAEMSTRGSRVAWKFTSPSGQIYTSKKAALEAKEKENALASGDPPWRTAGHEYLGRRVRWTVSHAVSARRVIEVEQLGEVVGYISETDVDSTGAAGFVSDRTGKPAKLFHVVFDPDPHHPYAKHMAASTDMEDYELNECLLPEDAYQPAKKRARK